MIQRLLIYIYKIQFWKFCLLSAACLNGFALIIKKQTSSIHFSFRQQVWKKSMFAQRGFNFKLHLGRIVKAYSPRLGNLVYLKNGCVYFKVKQRYPNFYYFNNINLYTVLFVDSHSSSSIHFVVNVAVFRLFVFSVEITAIWECLYKSQLGKRHFGFYFEALIRCNVN